MAESDDRRQVRRRVGIDNDQPWRCPTCGATIWVRVAVRMPTPEELGGCPYLADVDVEDP